MQVDKGGIPRVVTGANIMCPGLTSPGGYITKDLEVGTIVAIYGEGKQYPFAIGKMLMSSQQMYYIIIYIYYSLYIYYSFIYHIQNRGEQGNCH